MKPGDDPTKYDYLKDMMKPVNSPSQVQPNIRAQKSQSNFAMF